MHWPAKERSALLGAALAVFATCVQQSTWGGVTLPVQQAFKVDVQGEVLLRQLPDIAGLFAIPLVGTLGAGVSAFRIAVAAAASMLVGAVIMTAAPAFGWMVLGMSLTSIGRTMVGVLAFSAVAAAIADDARRTAGYAMLGAAGPAAYIVGPVLGAGLLGVGGWRWVGALWMASAFMLVLAAWWLRSVPSNPATEGRKEPWTPILAGVTLVGIVQAVGAVSLHGIGSFEALAWIGGTLAAVAAWFGLARVLPSPSLDMRVLRIPGLLPILCVAMVAQCGDIWFYVAVLARFVHGLTPLQVSLALLVAQFAALGGACLAGWLMPRIGLRGAGTLLLALFAASMFVSCVQSTALPLWITVAVLSVAGVAEIGTGVCVSKAIMVRAPKGLESPVASCRSAATGVGNALALLLVVTSVGYAMRDSMRQQAQDHGASPADVQQLVDAVRRNTTNTVISRQLELTPEQTEQLRSVRREVIVDGFQTHGLVSGIVLAIAAAGFWLVCRNPEQQAAQASQA